MLGWWDIGCGIFLKLLRVEKVGVCVDDIRLLIMMD